MKFNKIFKSSHILVISLAIICSFNVFTQSLKDEMSEFNSEKSFLQQPTKKVYFVPGGKFGMFFLQGDFEGNQLIALEGFGQYRAKDFFAELSVPFRFKTNPGYTDIGLDINVFYPFLGTKNKSELDPYVGGGLGIHFIGYDRGDSNISVAARGGMGLNVIAGVIFMKSYDFNIVTELKYFNYLRELDDKHYHGIGLNVGVMIH